MNIGADKINPMMVGFWKLIVGKKRKNTGIVLTLKLLEKNGDMAVESYEISEQFLNSKRKTMDWFCSYKIEKCLTI